MQKLKSAAKWLVEQRWFPTVTRPLLAGAIGSGIVLIAHSFGIDLIPGQVEMAVSPFVGLLIASIVERSGPKPVDTAHMTVTVDTQALMAHIDALAKSMVVAPTITQPASGANTPQ